MYEIGVMKDLGTQEGNVETTFDYVNLLPSLRNITLIWPLWLVLTIPAFSAWAYQLGSSFLSSPLGRQFSFDSKSDLSDNLLWALGPAFIYSQQIGREVRHISEWALSSPPSWKLVYFALRVLGSGKRCCALTGPTHVPAQPAGTGLPFSFSALPLVKRSLPLQGINSFTGWSDTIMAELNQ